MRKFLLIISFLFSVAQAQILVNGFKHTTSSPCNTNSGTLSSGATYASDVPSVLSGNVYSINFDGTSNGKVTPTTNIALSDNQAISMWFKTTNISTYPVLLSNGSFTGSGTAILGSGNFFLQTDAGASHNFSFSISNNTWYNLIVNRVGSGGARVYLNGTESSSGNTFIGTDNMTFQVMGYYPSEALVGKIADFRKFNSVLTSTDISNLASGSAPVTASSLHWKMNEGSGTTAYDWCGN